MTSWHEETVEVVTRRFKLKTPVFMDEVGKLETVAAHAWWDSRPDDYRKTYRPVGATNPMTGIPADALTYKVEDDMLVIEFSYEKPVPKKLPPLPEQRHG